MGNVVTFDFEDIAVRTATIDGVTWFIGKDVCRALGLVDHNKALARLPDDERISGVATTHPSDNRYLAIGINEAGVYRLIFESRKPEAERFKHWVFHDVLPALRKTGRYGFDDVDWDEVDAKLNLVKQVRLTHGRKAARDMWARIGLPPVLEAQKPPETNELSHYVADFIDEVCVFDAAARVTAAELHRLYLRWATLHKAPHFVATTFGKMVASLGTLQRAKSNGQSVYLGIRIDAVKAKVL